MHMIRNAICLLLWMSGVSLFWVVGHPLEAAPGAQSYVPAQMNLLGNRKGYRPLSRVSLKGIRLEFPVFTNYSLLGSTAVPLGDSIPRGSSVSYAPSAAHDFQLRVGASLDTLNLYSPFFFRAHYEQDVYTGIFYGGESQVRGVALPFEQNQTQFSKNTLRKAYGELILGPFLHIQGGYTVSHWGLGLLANDGAHGWTPGSAYFGDPRGGDQVMRLSLRTGPWNDTLFVASYDEVLDDDIMLSGDRANQMIAAVLWGFKKKKQIGFYVVRREQTTPFNDGVRADKKTKVTAFDLYWKWNWKIAHKTRLEWQTEMVWIQGTTDLAPSPEHLQNEVLQAAVASRLSLDYSSKMGSVIDFMYASGDQNFDDGAQNAFKADPNYEMGLLLFKQVLAAQTARAPITASDPELVGYPNEDLDRFPTRKSISNTYLVFPRLWRRLTSGVEVYGGPLLAWGNVPLSDPRQTRLNGGFPANLLGGTHQSQFLGVEAALGLRSTLNLNGAEVMFGAEGAAFFPGGAWDGVSGSSLWEDDFVMGGRLIGRLRF